ncbi:MAG: nucleotide-binding universal stress UspA family protein [Myxococcota bacterium]|jgi:nucleotide-binding universal stress UspA family protein
MTPRTIVVGLDGSSSSIHALRWACHQGFGDRIEAVLAWDDTTSAHKASESLANMVADVRAQHDVEIVEVVVYGAAGVCLLEQAEHADLIVVGRRGTSIAKVLLGSVSRRVLHNARIPVVVVPEDAPLDYAASVVVGIDGSHNATEALEWALDLETGQIDVVHAWKTPGPYPWFVDAVLPDEVDPEAVALCDRVVREACKGAPDMRIVIALRRGDARSILVDTGLDPGLIVVGSRSHTGLFASLVGSVASHVASHAEVAVAVIPDQTTSGAS